MKVITVLFFLIVSVCAMQADPRQWGPEGIPIRQGQHLNWNRTMSRDASGNTLVLWSDKRNGDRDVRAQLYSSAGVPLWADSGINVAPNNRHQDSPVAVAVTGGWIVAWLDYRHCYLEGGCSDVYAQKLDPNGNRVWADNDYTGVAVDVAERWIEKPSLAVVPDGAGGAYLTWVDSRYDYSVLAQRVMSNGTVAWPQVLVVNDVDYTNGTGIASGTDGSMLIAWWGGYADDDVYLSRVLSDGSLPWGLSGMPVCTLSGDQGHARIAPDGANGCYVAWVDNRNGYSDIYGQHLSSGGQPLWTANGMALCTAEYGQWDVEIAPSFDGGIQNGFAAVWEDQRAGGESSAIFGQKVFADSSMAWAPNGLRISDEPPANNYRYLPVVTTDHNGGLVCVWAEHSDDLAWYSAQLVGARLNAAGVQMWSSDPQPVGAFTYRQERAVIGGDFGVYSVAWLETDTMGTQSVRYQLLDHSDGSRLLGDAGIATMTGFPGNVYNSQCAAMSGHRTAVVWEDTRPWWFGTMLYYQIVGPQGEIERAINGEPLAPNNTGSSQYQQEHPSTCEDGNGGILVAFVDTRWGTKLIRLSHINAGGVITSPDSGAIVWAPPGIRDQQNAQPCPDGENGYYVAWSGYTANFWIEAYVMRLDADLQPLWDQPVRLSESFADDIVHAVVASNGCCLVVWQSGDYYNYNISAAKVCADGSVAWNDTLCDAAYDQDHPVAVSDGSGGMYVAWQDARTSPNDRDIYAQRVASDGTPYWTTNGVVIATATQGQWLPEIVVDGHGDLNVVWQDFRNGVFECVYAQKLSPSGELRWTPSGVAVNLAGQSSDLALVASEGRNGMIPVWIDGRNYNYGAFATHLDSTGTVFGDPFWRPDSGGAMFEPLADVAHHGLSAAGDGWGGCVLAALRYSSEYEGGEGGSFTIDLYAQRVFDYASDAETPESQIPRKYALHQNYPNPFNPVTAISFDLPQAQDVKLTIFDLLGREVRVLTDEPLAAGAHRVTFNAPALPSGVYVYQLEAGDFRQAKKLVLLR